MIPSSNKQIGRNEVRTNRKRFKQVEKMLFDLSWRFSSEHFPFKDAKTEAYWGFMVACGTYQEGRGMSFSSWCYFKVWGHFCTLLSKRSKDRHIFVDEVKDEVAGPAPANHKPFLDMVEDLSADARLMLRMFLDTPKEILATVPTQPEELYEQVCDHLGFEKGWDSAYTAITALEIRSRLEESLNWKAINRKIEESLERKRLLNYFQDRAARRIPITI